VAITRDIVEALGGRKIVGTKVDDAEALLMRIRQGLPYASYEHVAHLLEASLEEVGQVLNLPARTRARRKREKRLEPGESDRLVRLARILATAGNVLGSPDKAAQWLRRPNRALGGEAPLHLLDTEVGEQLVQEVLGRLEYGVVS
jgi:putative toxin-antitoxin system antitoxin component (TIGR02293 family)